MRLSTELRDAGSPPRHLIRTLIYGGGFDRVLRLCESTQWLAPEQFAAWQWEQLLAALHEAHRSSPLCRKRLDDAGWPLADREMFSRLAPLTKVEAVLYASQIAARRRTRGYSRTSGGSAGMPVPVPVDQTSYPWYVAGTSRGLRWWGTDFFDRAVILLGRSRGSYLWSLAAKVKDWATGWLRVPVHGPFDYALSALMPAVIRFRPRFIYGYPSAVYRLARAVSEAGLPDTLRPRVVVLTGEPLFEFQRQTIQAIFDAPVVEEYGCGELGSLAFQCPAGSLHVTAESVLLETPVVEGGQNSPSPILATHLHNTRFPLIRYDTGDLGVLEFRQCTCGRGLPVLHLVGRAADRLMGFNPPAPAVPYLRRFIGALPSGLRGHVQVREVEPGRLVMVIERNGADPWSARELQAAVAVSFGAQRHVGVVQVDRLPRLPSGKLPYFVPCSIRR